MVQFARAVNASRIGTTAWFRNEAFLRTLTGLLRQVESPCVLFHACSTGEEPYSFATIWQEMGGGPIAIDATDIEPTFIEKARQIEHPRLTQDARNTVSFLPPASCSESFARTYDAVICMNALCYLPEDEQRLAIDRMASCASRYLCITAGSPWVVKRGIEAADMRPVWLNWMAIYYGWRERLSWRHRKTWKLPYLPLMLPHWRYAGTSIFERAETVRHQAPETIARQSHGHV